MDKTLFLDEEVAPVQLNDVNRFTMLFASHCLQLGLPGELLFGLSALVDTVSSLTSLIEESDFSLQKEFDAKRKFTLIADGNCINLPDPAKNIIKRQLIPNLRFNIFLSETIPDFEVKAENFPKFFDLFTFTGLYKPVYLKDRASDRIIRKQGEAVMFRRDLDFIRNNIMWGKRTTFTMPKVSEEA